MGENQRLSKARLVRVQFIGILVGRVVFVGTLRTLCSKRRIQESERDEASK